MTIKTLCRAVFVGSILIISTVFIFSCEEVGDSPESPGVTKKPSRPTEELPPGEKTYDEFGGQPADRVFTISGAEDWTDALTAISEGADDGEANYIIDIAENVSVPGSTAPTFGSRDDIVVIIQGDDTTLSLSGNGNLIKTAADQTVSVQDSVTLEGKAGNNNSVVSVPAGVFEMSDTAKVTGNNTTSAGGGVLVAGGAFTMKGQSSVTGNSSNAGGGVGVNGGTFTMTEDASISGNITSDDGGGVYVNGGTFTMGGRAKITGNIAHNDSSSVANGGGVLVNKGLFVMKEEAEISGNTAWGSKARAGGGVQVVGGSFRIGGGTITGYDASHDVTAHNPANPEDRDSCNINWTGAAAVDGSTLSSSGSATQYGLLDDETGEFTEGGTNLTSTGDTIHVVNGVLQKQE